MENNRFYYLKERVFDSRAFIEEYANMYFESDNEFPCPFPFLNKTEREDEDKVLKLLTKDYKWTCEDVLNILVWKTGAKKYEYSNERITLTPLGRKAMDITKLASLIVAKQEDLRRTAYEYDFLEAYRSILAVVFDADAKNIGPVYCITLLFFLSMGKIAIYDKQAHKSLLAIKNRILPGYSVGYVSPADKTAKEKVCKMYNEYYQMLIELFPDYANGNTDCKRRIDRALWVYGHYFKA